MTTSPCHNKLFINIFDDHLTWNHSAVPLRYSSFLIFAHLRKHTQELAFDWSFFSKSPYINNSHEYLVFQVWERSLLDQRRQTGHGLWLLLAPHSLVTPAGPRGRREACLDHEALQETNLLQLLPRHAGGCSEARPVLHLWVNFLQTPLPQELFCSARGGAFPEKI